MPTYNVRFDIADVRYIAFEKFCKKHNIEFSIQPLLQQTPVSGSLPPTQITKLRNELYDAIPTEGVTEWTLLKVIKQHIKKMDELAERFSGNDR